MSLSSATAIPDSAFARAITEFIRETETELLFNPSSQVYQFGALVGLHRGLTLCSVIRASRWPGGAHEPGCGCGCAQNG